MGTGFWKDLPKAMLLTVRNVVRHPLSILSFAGPRFHLFGPNVEYANRMESTGVPGKVQISCLHRNFYWSWSQLAISESPWGLKLPQNINDTGWWFGTFFIFPYIENNNPNWLSYFSEGLKPPTRIIIGLILPIILCDWCIWCLPIVFNPNPPCINLHLGVLLSTCGK